MTDKKSKFSNPKNLNKLKELVLDGLSSVEIALFFGCHHSSIIYQMKKHGITWNNKTKIHKANKAFKRIKTKPGHCPICTMLLKSPYHMQNPCEPVEKIEDFKIIGFSDLK